MYCWEVRRSETCAERDLDGGHEAEGYFNERLGVSGSQVVVASWAKFAPIIGSRR